MVLIMKRAIVFGITKDLDFALANMLIGIKKHLKCDIDKFIILNDSLSNEQKISFKKIHKNVEFVYFSKEYVFERLGFKNQDNNKINRILERYSHFYFCKFEIIDYLKIYDQVLWLDCDMLVQNDFSTLFDVDDSIAWVPTRVKFINKIRGLENDFVSKFNFSVSDLNNISQPNGGLILLNKNLLTISKLNSNFLYEVFIKLISFTDKHNLDEISFATLAMLNKVQVKNLHVKYNSYAWKSYASKSIIVHAMGKFKFWNTNELYNNYKEWGENSNVWNNLYASNKQCKFLYDAEYEGFLIKKRSNHKVKSVLALKNINDRLIFDFKMVYGEFLKKQSVTVKKIWIYKEVCSVVDVLFKEISLAFNIFPNVQGSFDIEMLQRKDSKSIIIGNKIGDKECLVKNISLDEVCDVIIMHLEKIIVTIHLENNSKST